MLKYIITDFDGTLVHTLEANICAYEDAFERAGLTFDRLLYTECYGLRFDALMDKFNVPEELRPKIKRYKKDAYLNHLDKTIVNWNLLEMIGKFDGKIAIASTASMENLFSVLYHHKLDPEIFDAIVTGEMVEKGKPEPDVYIKAYQMLGAESTDEILVFEDSEIGVTAAIRAGINNVFKL